jgi:hypothetical protein
VNAQVAWRVAVVVLLFGVMAVQYQQYRVLERVAEHMADVPDNALVTSWKSGGEVIVVTTKGNVGESDAALLVRHTKAVAAKLEDFPRDQ